MFRRSGPDQGPALGGLWKLSQRMIALVLPVLWSCAVDDGVGPANTSVLPLFNVSSGIHSFVSDVENTGAHFPEPNFPSFDRLPINRILPEPFRTFDGPARPCGARPRWVGPGHDGSDAQPEARGRWDRDGRCRRRGGVDVSFEGWRRRRAELKAAIEKYEIGPKPDPWGVDIIADYVDGQLTVVVTRKSNQRSLTLTSPINLPSGSGPFPAVIGMTFFGSGGTGSLPVDIFTSRDIARIPFFHNQVTSVSFSDASHADDPYFHLYPEFSSPGNVGQYSAWSWGVSRLIDGLYIAARQSENPLPIDLTRLAVTGCSYAGKMALFAGALDERVALTIAQESGGGGAPAWRVSHAIEPDGTVEKIDNTSGTWFIQGMKTQFMGDNVYKLPHDHHELMAMVAPRALLVTGNTDFVWLSNRSAYVSARAAQETYTELGIGDRFGFYIDGGHGHCAIPESQRPAIEAFVDKFLLDMNVETDVQVHPFPDLDYQPWMPWSLRSDIAQLVSEGTLTAHQGARLSHKLNAALASLAEGKTTPALNQLRAFNHRVGAFVHSGALTPEQGAALIDRINATRELVGAWRA